MYALVTGKPFNSLMLLLILFQLSDSKEILSYKNGDTSRVEQGTPGTSVTGQWSWMDYNGQKRTIRYIADNKGFRAFGDVIPETDWSKGEDSNMPKIGSSVVPSMPTIGDDDTTVEPLLNLESKPIEAQIVDDEIQEKQNLTDTELDNNSLVNSQIAMDSLINLIHSTSMQKSDEGEVSQTRPLIFETDKLQKPRKIPGTSFILLNHKRLPAREPATDIPRASEIKPIPVEVSGKIHSPITGILTAPRAINVLDSKIGKELISIPKTIDRIVPKPSKVEGMLNLDNYLRPAHVTGSGVRTQTSKPSENDYDYYYYDYYYDDTPDGQTKSKKNGKISKQRTVRSEESRESSEDFEDLSKEKRRV